jgi:hypothetical protein
MKNRWEGSGGGGTIRSFKNEGPCCQYWSCFDGCQVDGAIYRNMTDFLTPLVGMFLMPDFFLLFLPRSIRRSVVSTMCSLLILYSVSGIGIPSFYSFTAGDNDLVVTIP